MKSKAKEGRDPALDARRERAGVTVPNTVGELVQEYLSILKGKVAAKTHKIERDLLEGVLTPKLGTMLVADLSPADVGAVIRQYAARLKKEGRSDGANANKLLAATRRMFKRARGEGLAPAGGPGRGDSRKPRHATRLPARNAAPRNRGARGRTAGGDRGRAMSVDPRILTASAEAREAVKRDYGEQLCDEAEAGQCRSTRSTS